MGCCLPCFGNKEYVEITPDQATKRQQMAEAAEKRRMETESKGVKDPDGAKRRAKKREAIENAEDQPAGGGGGLRWQVGR